MELRDFAIPTARWVCFIGLVCQPFWCWSLKMTESYFTVLTNGIAGLCNSYFTEHSDLHMFFIQSLVIQHLWHAGHKLHVRDVLLSTLVSDGCSVWQVLASKTKIYMVLEYVNGGELFDKIVRSSDTRTIFVPASTWHYNWVILKWIILIVGCWRHKKGSCQSKKDAGFSSS